MSYTSLWTIDKNWSGKEYTEYKNSHLFCPIIWDILLCKYINKNERKKEYYPYDVVNHYLMWVGFCFDKEEANKRWGILNDRINKSELQYDRVLWELSGLSVFNAKDKYFVADCIEKFWEENSKYYDITDNEHIKERFLQISKDIRELPKSAKYFVIHPTSCDDNVEWWFNCHRLSYWDKYVCEFTIIENDRIVGFCDNLQMCGKSDSKAD